MILLSGQHNDENVIFDKNITHSFPSESFKDAVRPFVTSIPRIKEEGGVRGVRKLQNRPKKRINTAIP